MAFEPERRRLLQALAGLPFLGRLVAHAAEAPVPGPPASKRSAPSRSLVARCRRDGLLGEKGVLHPGKLDEVLGAALTRAAGEETPIAVMRRLFRPSDVVGLKVNSLAGRGLSPNPGLVERLCGWLQQAGVPARNIVIWDRTDRELEAAGFRIARSGAGVRCVGTNDDYDWTPREWGPGGSCFARLLVEDLTALINVGMLKDHDLAGVSIGLKNWYGSIHNPNKHHDQGCAPYIPHLAAYPLIRDKLRLTVIDATTAQCHGGPARNPRWTWRWNGVLASTDPVALDAVGWRMIEERRREVGLPPLAEEKREPVWIAAAAKLGLGEADLARIEVEDA
ncbi:MAG: DUF362 domain-containing protein [Acidobacteriota bacterium]